MSKSLGNFFTVRDIVKKFDYEVIRFFLLSAHYRSPINFSDDLLLSAQNALDRLYECRDNLRFLLGKAQAEDGGATGTSSGGATSDENELDSVVSDGNSSGTMFEEYKEHFIEAMDDDLNTADAVAVLFDLVRAVNTRVADVRKAEQGDVVSIPLNELQQALEMLMELSRILGLLGRERDTVAMEVESLIAQRQAARKEKNWAESDRLRDRLKEMGIELQDTPQGVKWKKAL